MTPALPLPVLADSALVVVDVQARLAEGLRALGAATGTPARRISSRATGCNGIRTPTIVRPAVTISGTAAERGSSSVSGPGQHAAVSFVAVSGIPTVSPASAALSAICTITGSQCGRSLAAKIRATAASSSAFAPSP